MKDPKLVWKYRVLDQDIAAFDDKLQRVRGGNAKLFIPTLANRRLMQAELDALFVRQKAIEAPDEVFSIVKDHYADFLDGIQLELNTRYDSPARSVRGIGFTSIFRRDPRPDCVRKKAIENQMEQYNQLFTAMLEWLPELPADETNTLLGRINSLCTNVGNERGDVKEFLKELTEAEQQDLLDKMEAFAGNDLLSFARKLEDLIAAKGGVSKQSEGKAEPLSKVSIEAYRNALTAHGVDLDDILGWHETEVERTKNECFLLANALDLPEGPVTTMKQVNEILFKYAGPCDSPEEMFRRAAEYVTRGTAAAREYVWLPKDAVCLPAIMDKHMKASYPWGAGGSCNPDCRPFDGRFMLNDENYKAITDGWIKINCTHEVHPGHYTQFLRAILDPMPETFKRGAKHTCLTEAMCVRTEKLFEYIFAEDRFYPLFTAFRRHHTSVRIKVDLWLRYFGKSFDDLMELYKEELDFDPITCRKQVQAHLNDLGYFTTYYYGYKKISEWEKLYGFEKKEYTELLFSAGRVSLDTFERYLKLCEADRYSLTHEFASLNQTR